jgi:hypothetical protein
LSERGSAVTSANLPSLEPLIYVAVYFRQLYSNDDKLFKSACDTYNRFVDNDVKRHWVKNEKESFEGILKARTIPCEFTNTVNRELIEAFLYGALILHSIEGVKKTEMRDKFKELETKYAKEKIAFCLNTCFKLLLNHVSNVAAVIYQDFAHWQSKYTIPKPDIFWHSSIFGKYKAGPGEI